LQKWVTVVNIFHTKKVFYTWKDGSDLQQGVIIGKKIGHTWIKMFHIWKSESHLEKWVTLGKTGNNSKNR